jgi:hypothetical protein
LVHTRARRVACFRASRLASPGVGLAACLLVAGCGGGSRQDAGEHAASYTVKVVHASFPLKQSIARPERMELVVKNTGSRTVPNLAVTVDSFDYASNYPELAANKRPIWAIEEGPGAIARPPVQSQEVSQPGGAQTNYVNTWALGALAAGATQKFVWSVIPVKPGSHTVHFTVEAGLTGKASAKLASGGPAVGEFNVQIAATPPSTRVDPATGKVVEGTYPATP